MSNMKVTDDWLYQYMPVVDEALIRGIEDSTDYEYQFSEQFEKKMEQLGTQNQRAYLRKMAVDGYVVRVDMTDVKELAALLRTCSNNLNQIAKRVNSTGNLYGEDIADLKARYGELWGAFSSLLSKFEDL